MRKTTPDSPRSPRSPKPTAPAPGKSPREYGHSSGDRNTKTREGDWPEFHGGRQRDDTPAAPRQKR